MTFLLINSDKNGVCYLETCDLDGESSLKRRQAAPGFDDTKSDFKLEVEVIHCKSKLDNISVIKIFTATHNSNLPI